jgi:hypothetical protein
VKELRVGGNLFGVIQLKLGLRDNVLGRIRVKKVRLRCNAL